MSENQTFLISEAKAKLDLQKKRREEEKKKEEKRKADKANNEKPQTSG